ncbi:MAG: hypothetical protein ACFFD4_07975 [Candidatus Odinarchaeota archaeon]
MSTDNSNTPRSLLTEARYCLFLELEPALIQLYAQIKKEGFLERYKRELKKYNSLLLSNNDINQEILQHLFDNKITTISLIEEETGTNWGNSYRFFKRLLRMELVQEFPVKDLAPYSGRQNRMKLYAVNSVTREMAVTWIKNHWPEMFVDPEEEKEQEKSQKPAKKKKTKELVLCSFCNWEIGNGVGYCETCGITLQKPEGNNCPSCGKQLLRYCTPCGMNRAVKFVEVEA